MRSTSSALPGVQRQQSVHAAEPYTSSRRASWGSERIGSGSRRDSCFAQLDDRLAGEGHLRLVDTGFLAGADSGDPLLTRDRLAYRRRDLDDQRDGRRLRRHPAATPGIRLRTATRIAQDALNGYDPRHLDMLTPDRPRRCRAQLAHAVCAELQAATRSALGSAAPVEPLTRSSGVYAAATRRRAARLRGGQDWPCGEARGSLERVAGYPAGDGGSGVGVLSTRR
jgi:hypothetical protein